MNDLAFQYKFHILEEGGVYSHAVPSIISKLNHMPMGAIKYNYSIDALQALYQNVTWQTGYVLWVDYVITLHKINIMVRINGIK